MGSIASEGRPKQMAAVRPPRRVVYVLSIVVAALAMAPGAEAVTPPDDCAQKVILDWRSGGGIDDGYPLGCYDAALRALPEDVVQYSNADQEIRQAQALARAAGAPADTKDATTRAEASASQRTTAEAAAAPVTTAAPATAVPSPILALTALSLAFLALGGAGRLAARRRSGSGR